MRQQLRVSSNRWLSLAMAYGADVLQLALGVAELPARIRNRGSAEVLLDRPELLPAKWRAPMILAVAVGASLNHSYFHSVGGPARR